MSLDTTLVRFISGLNPGTAIVFTFDTPGSSSSHVKVYVRDETDADAITETLKTVSTHYTIDMTTKTVTMLSAPTSTQRVVVVRDIPDTQPADLSGSNNYPANSVETQLDKIVAQVQQANERIDRAPTMKQGTASSLLPVSLPDPTANYYLGWNSAGNALENKAATASTGAGDVLGPASSTDNALAKWSGTAGDTLSNTGVICDNSNNLSGIETIASGAIVSTGSVSGTNITGTGFGNFNDIYITDQRTISSGPTTLNLTDYLVFVSTTGGAHTINLPTAVGSLGKIYVFKKTTSDFTACTIDGNSSETIGGSATTTLNTVGETLVIISDNANWQILDRKTEVPWTAFTPTGGFVTNVTYAGYWRRIGDTLEVKLRISMSGAPNSSNCDLVIPFSLTINTSKTTGAVSSQGVYGQCLVNDQGGSIFPGSIQYESTTSLFVFVANSSTTYATCSGVTEAIPVTFGNTDTIDAWYSVPITGWNA